MRLFIASVVTCFAVCAGETDPPPATPQVASVFPHGGRRGTEIGVEFRGTLLAGATGIRFRDNQLEASIESAAAESLRARIRIAADAELGPHEFRLAATRGAWFGVFYVGDIPETTEREPNDVPSQAQLIAFPALINGRADGADSDYYRFHAETGQTVVFDLFAARLGSALDPVLTLFDEHGREIGYNDDAYTFKDARLVHTFDRAGDYTLLVSASFERSARDAEYRLLATSGPYIESALPLGARRGCATEVSLRGWNLEGVTEVTLGRHLAQARILERHPNEVRVRFDLPKTIEPASYLLHGGGAPVRFEVGDLPEVTLARSDTVVPVPVVVNGEIRDAADRIHRVQSVEFDAKAGSRCEFSVDAWKLGRRFDAVVTLLDSSGRTLAEEDDPAPNSFIHYATTHDPRLVYAFPADGRYRIQVHDAAYETGSYRLVIRETRPDFEIEVRSPQFTVVAGREGRLQALVRRTGGVHQVQPFRKPDSEIEHFRLIERDGWNTPIRVWVDGLPEGVTAEPVNAEPKVTTFKGNDGEELFVDGTLVEIPIRSAAGVRPGLYEIAVRGRGAWEGRDVEHRGSVVDAGVRSMSRPPARDRKLLLNVLEAAKP